MGAQGNDLREISLNSINDNCGIIVNISRDIIYSDSSTSFELKVRDKALEYQNEMESILDKKDIIWQINIKYYFFILILLLKI